MRHSSQELLDSSELNITYENKSKLVKKKKKKKGVSSRLGCDDLTRL